MSTDTSCDGSGNDEDYCLPSRQDVICISSSDTEYLLTSPLKKHSTQYSHL